MNDTMVMLGEPVTLTTDQIDAIQQLLDEATGPSRDIDWKIAEALNLPEPWKPSAVWPPFMDGSKFDKAIPQFSASIDAAAGLIDHLQPGWYWTLARHLNLEPQPPEGKPFYADVASKAWIEGEASHEEQGEAFGATIPLAILSAIFKAELRRRQPIETPDTTEMDAAFGAG